MLKKLFSHSFLYAVGPQVPKLVNIFILPVITQYLTPLDYGVYGTLIAYTGLLQGVKSLGFDVLLVNSFYKKSKWKAFWSRYLGGLYMYNILFALIYTFILYVFIPQEANENLWLLIGLIVVPTCLFDVTKMFGGRYFQLSQQPKYIAIVSAAVGVLSILINLYVIAYLRWGYLGWFISIAIGSFVTFCCYAIPLYFKVKLKPVFTFNKKFWVKSLKVSLPTIPHNYSTYLLNSSDRLVMDQLKTPINQIGVYNLAYIFGGYLELFGNAVGMAVGPYYAKLYAKKTELAEKQVGQLTVLLQFSFIVLCTIVALWSKQIFQLLITNKDLEIAYSISIFIIMGYAYRPIYWRAVNKLIFYEKTKKLWRVSFVAGALNVGLNFVFIPIYGVTAAAITTFGCLMYLGGAFYALNDYKRLNNSKTYAFLWLFLIIVLTAFIYILRDSDVFVKAIISLGITITYFAYLFKHKHKFSKIEV